MSTIIKAEYEKKTDKIEVNSSGDTAEMFLLAMYIISDIACRLGKSRYEVMKKILHAIKIGESVGAFGRCDEAERGEEKE